MPAWFISCISLIFPFFFYFFVCVCVLLNLLGVCCCLESLLETWIVSHIYKQTHTHTEAYRQHLFALIRGPTHMNNACYSCKVSYISVKYCYLLLLLLLMVVVLMSLLLLFSVFSVWLCSLSSFPLQFEMFNLNRNEHRMKANTQHPNHYLNARSEE